MLTYLNIEVQGKGLVGDLQLVVDVDGGRIGEGELAQVCAAN